jgi:hypothetical protein
MSQGDGEPTCVAQPSLWQLLAPTGSVRQHQQQRRRRARSAAIINSCSWHLSLVSGLPPAPPTKIKIAPTINGIQLPQLWWWQCGWPIRHPAQPCPGQSNRLLDDTRSIPEVQTAWRAKPQQLSPPLPIVSRVRTTAPRFRTLVFR